MRLPNQPDTCRSEFWYSFWYSLTLLKSREDCNEKMLELEARVGIDRLSLSTALILREDLQISTDMC